MHAFPAMLHGQDPGPSSRGAPELSWHAPAHVGPSSCHVGLPMWDPSPTMMLAHTQFSATLGKFVSDGLLHRQCRDALNPA